MSVFQMSILTFLISFGFAGYAWCNWQSEKIRLNDIKDTHEETVRFEQCRYCGCISFAGTGCLDPDCPGSK